MIRHLPELHPEDCRCDACWTEFLVWINDAAPTLEVLDLGDMAFVYSPAAMKGRAA